MRTYLRLATLFLQVPAAANKRQRLVRCAGHKDAADLMQDAFLRTVEVSRREEVKGKHPPNIARSVSADAAVASEHYHRGIRRMLTVRQKRRKWNTPAHAQSTIQHAERNSPSRARLRLALLPVS